MRYGLSIGNFAEYADARLVASVAREAEDAGWDGVFVWDHLTFVKAWRLPVGDRWTILAAVALATERVRLGPMVTPLPRRRPQVVARQTVTLDHLSGGRLVFGVGLGEPAEDEFTTFGEPADRGTRAAMLDESLEVVAALWSGEPVTRRGRFYTVDDVAFLPTPVQSPRIPVWVAATVGFDRPLVRAARWDGVHPVAYAEDGSDRSAEPADIAAMRTRILSLRADAGLPPGPYDILSSGDMTWSRRPAQVSICRELADAGATWWLHAVTPRGGPVDAHLAIIRDGPPV